jgi:hypothetical protein
VIAVRDMEGPGPSAETDVVPIAASMAAPRAALFHMAQLKSRLRVADPQGTPTQS